MYVEDSSFYCHKYTLKWKVFSVLNLGVYLLCCCTSLMILEKANHTELLFFQDRNNLLALTSYVNLFKLVRKVTVIHWDSVIMALLLWQVDLVKRA